MWSSRLCKNCWKCPSLLLHVHSSSSWSLWHSSKCKVPRLSTLNHLTCCDTYPCALMQMLTLKEQVFFSNAYKQALTTKNEKSESSYAWVKLPSTKNCVDGHKLGTRLIWSWVLVQNRVWHLVQPLCIFSRLISSFVHCFGQTGVLMPSFNDFTDNSNEWKVLNKKNNRRSNWFFLT
jgi:hypothetical protein